MKPPVRLLTDHSNPEMIVDSENATIIPRVKLDDGPYFVAAVNACHRLGLTTSQLEAGALERLVEVTKEVHRLCQCQYADAKICPMRKLADALAPFQQERTGEVKTDRGND